MNVYPEEVSFVFRPIVVFNGLDRTPKDSAFKVTPLRTQKDLRKELAMIGVESCIIQADLAETDIRLDGMPKANARYRSSRVIVSFEHPEQGAVAFPCGTYTDLWHNVRAIVMVMKALRDMDRHGATMQSQQYTGFKALPAGGDAIIPAAPGGGGGGFGTLDDAARFLFEHAGHEATRARIEEMLTSGQTVKWVYKLAAKECHPDNGGDASGDAMARVNAARDMIRAHIERAGGRS